FNGAESLPKEWTIAAEAVTEAANASGYGLKNIKVPGGPESFLHVIETAKPKVLEKLVPSNSGVEVMQELASRLSVPAQASPVPDLCGILISMQRPWPWKEFATTARAFIDAQPAAQPGVIAALASFRLLRKSDATVASYLAEFSNNQILLEKLG